jgi:hypothetical protein
MVRTTFDAQPLTRDLVLINIHNERAEHLWRMPIAVHLKSCKAEWSRPILPVDRLCCRCQIVNGLGARKRTAWPCIARDQRTAGVLRVFRTSSGLNASSPSLSDAFMFKLSSYRRWVDQRSCKVCVDQPTS